MSLRGQLVVIRHLYLRGSLSLRHGRFLLIISVVVKSALAITTRCPIATIFHHALFYFRFGCVVNPLLALLAVKHLPQSAFLDRESANLVLLVLNARRALDLISFHLFFCLA